MTTLYLAIYFKWIFFTAIRNALYYPDFDVQIEKHVKFNVTTKLMLNCEHILKATLHAEQS